jgi:hypothetical protein
MGFWHKKARQTARADHLCSGLRRNLLSALACLEPTVDLVDNVYAAPTSHDTAVLVAFLKRLERIDNFHGVIPRSFSKIQAADHMHSLNRCQRQALVTSPAEVEKISCVFSYTAKFREARESEGSLPETVNPSDVVR